MKLKNYQGYLIAQDDKNGSSDDAVYYVLINFVSADTGLDLNIKPKI
ncbi:hypothetical protein ACOBV8_19815 (plasmid) [Pseudoalteromonas espejiana]